MRAMLMVLSVTLIFVLFTHCKKSNISRIENNDIKTNKVIRNAPPSSLILVPSAYTARIGFICDGAVTPCNTYIINYNLIIAVNQAPPIQQPFLYNIVNPMLLGNLGFYIESLVLTGISYAPNWNPIFQMPDIYLSYTSSLGHRLFYAVFNGIEYEITSEVFVSATFAPPSDWTLHDIELHGTKLYGIFTNNTNNTSILSEIDQITGNSSILYTLQNKLVTGMDLVGNNCLMLVFEPINATSYGRIYTFDINTFAINTIDLQIPMSNPSSSLNLNWTAGSNNYNYFLSSTPTKFDKISIYNSGNTTAYLLGFDITTPAIPVTIASTVPFHYEINSNTFTGWPFGVKGIIITDATNF